MTNTYQQTDIKKQLGLKKKSLSNKPKRERIMEAVCIQHEIDHLNGVTVMDREYKRKPIRVSQKWGRNEIVGITDGKELVEMKYKKAKPLIDSGKWEIYIGGPITV